jgi:hypothetical protein
MKMIVRHIAAKLITLQFCIQEILASNLRSHTGYTYFSFFLISLSSSKEIP